MIVAIEGQDGIGKTSAINEINQFMHVYQYGMKFPAYSYPKTSFFTDADYLKNTAKLCIETFFNSKSFVERADALRRFDFVHTTDKLLCTKELEAYAKKGDIYLFDRYSLSQAVYSKCCAELLLEDYDNIYSENPDPVCREMLKDLWYNVGMTNYMVPKARLTIVFIADSNTIKDRMNNREVTTNDSIDVAMRLQEKLNHTYTNKIFTEQYSNSDYTVTINTTGMTVRKMAEKIQSTIWHYCNVLPNK